VGLQLLAYTYGFTSLRVLLLVFEVSIFDCTPSLTGASLQRSWYDTPSKCIADALPRKVWSFLDTKSPFLVWSSPSRLSEPEIFPFVGGLTMSDTRYLLEVLYAERKPSCPMLQVYVSWIGHCIGDFLAISGFAWVCFFFSHNWSLSNFGA
jgi:hypothetical protein